MIPESWPGFTATRVFRGVTYRITVARQGPGSAAALIVDGRRVDGSLIPLPPTGTGEVIVQAIAR